MRYLIALLILSFSLSSFAEQKTEFRHRVNCQTSRQKVEALVSGVEKISEDADEVTFQFVLSYGACTEDELMRAPVIVQRRSVSLTKYGFSLPGMAKQFKLNYEALGPDSVLVTASFTKKQKKFIMEFWPQNWTGFSFVLSLRNTEENTIMDLEGFEPL